MYKTCFVSLFLLFCTSLVHIHTEGKTLNPCHAVHITPKDRKGVNIFVESHLSYLLQEQWKKT